MKLLTWLLKTQCQGVSLQKFKGFEHHSFGFEDVAYSEQLNLRSPAPEEHPNFRFILEIPGGRLLGEYGHLLTPDHYILDESAITGHFNAQLLAPYLAQEPEILKLSGTVVSLAAQGYVCYFHWLLDVLPRLRLLEAASMKYDTLVMSPLSLAIHEEALTKLNIDMSRVVQLKPNLCIEAERLIFPSFMGNAASLSTIIDEDVMRWSQNRFRQNVSPQQAFRRLFISRSKTGARRIVNETSLIPILEDYGFEVIHFEDFSLSEQAKMAEESLILMGVHGSAFTNMIFCRPGTQIIDLQTPRIVSIIKERYPNYILRWMSDQLGLNHQVWVIEGNETYSGEPIDPNTFAFYDFEVPEQQFIQYLSRLD